MMNIADLLTDLAACLCVAIDKADVPSVCFCGVVPGDAAEQAYSGDCDHACGMAWVRLGTSYPAEYPGIQMESPRNCAVGLGFGVELGIMRCAPMPEMDGSPASPVAIAGAFDLQMKDMLLIRDAIRCCCALNSEDYILGSYTPMGPLGGLVGGMWALSIALV